MKNEYQIATQQAKSFEVSFAKLMRNVYAWMTGGLIMTALTGLIVANSPTLLNAIFSSMFVLIGLFVAELALVWILSARITRMSFLAAGLTFALYSILNGLTFSVIFLVYDMPVIIQTFFITAGVFAAMSIVGMVVKKDLSAMGKVLLMALIGLIVATIVNLFMHNTGLAMVINYIGVLIFVGLTAYDTQKIKQMAIAYGNDDELSGKLAVWGSLTLYLDFINLFLFLLRIFGGRK